MPRELQTAREPNRAAIYARVLDKSQAEEDKTSLGEQVADMEAHCERRGLRIVARYQEVGRGWSKKRPEFQRMLADAREGRFDVIVCWKSDRLSRGMFPAAALMEVVEAYQLRIESVMDGIDMKTFGLMAAIGKIELDNFRERAAMGKRGAAKQGRISTGRPPYGYRVGPDGYPAVEEVEAEVVRRIFHDYVERGLGIERIAWDLTDEGVPTATGMHTWHKSFVHQLLGNPVYTGTWSYGRTRNIATDEGKRVFAQPAESWIDVPVPPLVDAETFARAQACKRARLSRAKRNTKVLYLLQHLLRCAECGRTFRAQARWHAYAMRGGKQVAYDLAVPRRYYSCTGSKLRLRCREKLSIRAERLESRVWDEVKRVLQEPGVIIAGIEALGSSDGESLAEEQARAERDLREVQQEEERLVRLYVAGKISEEMLDLQRKFVTERLEHLRARVDDYKSRAATEVTREQLADSVQAWTAQVGAGLDALTAEGKRDVLQDVVDEITVDGENNLVITIAIPFDGEEHITPAVSRNPEARRGQGRSPRASPCHQPLSPAAMARIPCLCAGRPHHTPFAERRCQKMRKNAEKLYSMKARTHLKPSLPVQSSRICKCPFHSYSLCRISHGATRIESNPRCPPWPLPSTSLALAQPRRMHYHPCDATPRGRQAAPTDSPEEMHAPHQRPLEVRHRRLARHHR